MSMIGPGAGSRARARESRAAALTATLTELAEAGDALTIAVERHDLPALVGVTARAAELTARVDALTAALTPVERGELDPARVAVLGERLSIGARRNAYLIERAWALDATTMRLLTNLGRGAGDGSASGYGTAGQPPLTYLDRQA